MRTKYTRVKTHLSLTFQVKIKTYPKLNIEKPLSLFYKRKRYSFKTRETKSTNNSAHYIISVKKYKLSFFFTLNDYYYRSNVASVDERRTKWELPSSG
jgi:hypothetical protein